MSNININEINFKKFAKRLQKNSNQNMSLMEAQELLAKTFGATGYHELSLMLNSSKEFKINVGNINDDYYFFDKKNSTLDFSLSQFSCHSVLLGNINERSVLTEHIIDQYEGKHIYIFDGNNHYTKPVINKLFKKNEVRLINQNNQKIVDEKNLINIINMSSSNSNELFYNFKEEFAYKCFDEYDPEEKDKNVFGKEPKLIIFENCKLGSVALLPAQLRSAKTAIVFSYENEEELKRSFISKEEFASTIANVSSRYIFDEKSITSNSIINDNVNYYTLSLKDTKYKLYTHANKKRVSIEL